MTESLQGMILGQYEVGEQIYDGSVNVIEVYQAYQPSLQRAVAIYMLASEVRENPQYVQAMRRGAQISALYEHPNIVPVIDHGLQDGIVYLVTRLMQGGALRGIIQNRPIGFAEASAIVRQIASALDYVHTVGSVHGDPSTNNIVFDAGGSAYIAEFLLAGFLDVIAGGVLGTPDNMSPERWLMQAPTPSTDQYALAAIAYQTLTGHPVFDVDAIVIKHITEPPPPPQIHRSNIPIAINDVLFRGLAKKPEERYPTVMDFARDFERVLQNTSQHLFLSYSRRNKTYAQQLQQHMKSGGFHVWIDDAIEHGDQWFNQIHEAVKTCAAFLVIMTPDAEQSEWVQKEILLAKRYKKPIFPLLLDGDEFALLIDIQFADVRANEMPNTDFHRRVSRAVYGVG
jgi:serine/threonine protein kinase